MGVPPSLARREQHASGNVLENPYTDMQIGAGNRTPFFALDVEVFDHGQRGRVHDEAIARRRLLAE